MFYKHAFLVTHFILFVGISDDLYIIFPDLLQTDINGMLEYFIVDNPVGAQASQYFRINASTGAIRPRISLKDISIIDWTVSYLLSYIE